MVNPLHALALALLLVSSVESVLSADRIELPDTLQKHWNSLRLAFYHHGGDYESTGPAIVIQRLPDKRILLSYAGVTNGLEKLPLAERYIVEDDIAQIVTRVVGFWEKAKSELSPRERIAKLPPAQQAIIRAKAGFGIPESRMRIQISRFNQSEDDVFDKTIEESANDWGVFLMKAAGVNP